MLITLELKTMSASFQNLPTLPPQKYTKFSTPGVIQSLSNVLLNTAAEILLLLLLCTSYSNHQTDYLSKINSTNVRMRGTRSILKALAVIFHRGLKARHAIQIRNQLKQIKVIFQFTNAKSYFLVMKTMQPKFSLNVEMKMELNLSI